MTDLRARADAARNHPGVTCPVSRHVHELAEHMYLYGFHFLLNREPQHCAESMLAVCAALWEARAELAKMKGLT